MAQWIPKTYAIQQQIAEQEKLLKPTSASADTRAMPLKIEPITEEEVSGGGEAPSWWPTALKFAEGALKMKQPFLTAGEAFQEWYTKPTAATFTSPFYAHHLVT